jgi:predicted nucleic acid-binding protein
LAHYLDTSALVKLVVAEAESIPFRAWLLVGDRDPVTSDLTRTELLRTVRRAAPDRVVQAREALATVTLVAVTTAIFEEAGRLDPTTLRTLDAVHLASALELGDDLDGIVTYDNRLAEAARDHGIAVIAPT